LRRVDTRLLTLTGAGGSGKTRLALRIAETRARDYSDGVWFVGFADITDPELIASTICQALGLADKPGVRPTGRLREWLRDRSVLLLLDNLEQLVPGATVLGELLANCPRLGLLVTSRVSLSLAGEQQYEVPVLEPSDAVELFITRAHAVGPHLSIYSDVALQICERVDRLPLAIELAAARTKALSPVEILARLERRLPVLGTGPRDAPRRQRTLQATIDWSYDLLNEHEQRVFARLSVFAGGFTLRAAETVCDADLDTLQALTDRSLISVDHERSPMPQPLRTDALERLDHASETRELRRRHADGFIEPMHDGEPDTFRPEPPSRFMEVVAHQAGGTRYRMLDTLREFGLRRLRQAGEQGDAESSLLDWALDFVEAAAGEVETLGRSQVLPGVETERRNLVAAVATGGSFDTRLRLAAGLAELLSLGTGLREIRRVLEGALSAAGEANTSDVRRARLILGRLLRRLGQLDDARAHLTATARLAAAANDAVMAATIAVEQAFVEVKSRRHADARRFLDQADLLGASRDEQTWSYRLLVEADMRHVAGQRQEARGLYETCIERFRRHGPSMHLIAVLAALADLAVDMDDHETARSCALEILPLADPVVDAYLRAGALLALGRISLSAGRPAEATSWLAEAASLDIRRASMEAADTLQRLAQAIAAWGRHRDATLLLGAASAMRERFGIEPVALEQADIDSALTVIRAHLSDAAVKRSLEEGSRLSERELLELVHGVAPAVAQAS
jgi:predicted ATPase